MSSSIARKTWHNSRDSLMSRRDLGQGEITRSPADKEGPGGDIGG